MNNIAYKFDNETKEFLEEITLSVDAEKTKRTGETCYLIPANCTLVMPPVVGGYEVPVFKGEEWEIVKNYRNCFVVNSEMETDKIKELGDLPTGCVLISAEEKEKIENDKDFYIIQNGELIENPNYAEIKQQQEEDRVNRLTMTALDFINVLQTAGLTLEQINSYLETHLDLKMQLTYCQNVYCGVVKQLCPLSLGDITITSADVERAFKIKNGEDVAD